MNSLIELINIKDGIVYKVRPDGIPILIESESKKLTPESMKEIIDSKRLMSN